MSTPEAEGSVIAPHLEDDTAESRSIMDRLRRSREEAAESNTVDLPIPGYHGELVARYRLVESRELDKRAKEIMKQYKNQSDRLLFGAMDTLAIACVEIFIDPGGEGRQEDYIPVSKAIDSPAPVRYDVKLAEFLDFKTDGSRDVVFKTFAQNDIAITQHAIRLSRWMGDTTRDVSEDFLGEA